MWRVVVSALGRSVGGVGKEAGDERLRVGVGVGVSLSWSDVVGGRSSSIANVWVDRPALLEFRGLLDS